MGAVLAGSTLFLALAAPYIAPADPFSIFGPAMSPPSSTHPMGTDSLGRDVWSGVVWGARTSWFVALTVSIAAAVIGLLVGITSGMAPARWDDALMRLTEFFQTIPRFFLAIVVMALFGPGMDRLVAVLAATSWTGVARVVRAEILSLRQHDFINAARATGATEVQIATGDLLPNVLPVTAVLLGLIAGRVILTEAGLAFLGLGDPSAISWGTMAGQGQSFLRTAWWIALFPGGAITVSVLGLNLVNDALTDSSRGRE